MAIEFDEMEGLPVRNPEWRPTNKLIAATCPDCGKRYTLATEDNTAIVHKTRLCDDCKNKFTSRQDRADHTEK